MEIYTNAPSSLDYPGCKVVGDFGLGLLRVVSVSGARVTAKAQLTRYLERGFFSSLFRDDAIEFVTKQGDFEHPSISDFRMQDGEGIR